LNIVYIPGLRELNLSMIEKVAIPELGTSVGIGSFSGEQLEEREQEFRRMNTVNQYVNQYL